MGLAFANLEFLSKSTPGYSELGDNIQHKNTHYLQFLYKDSLAHSTMGTPKVNKIF
jgi:hypothetical protein